MNKFPRTHRVRTIPLRKCALAFAATFFALACRANAQTQTALPPAMETASGADAGGPPVSQSGGGDINYFSQDLGTILRLRYNTNSYGQDGTGNFDIGTMQVVTMDDTSAFFDGQVTMNETDGVGFNVGLGYRWMNFPPYDDKSGRMDGVSLWADGTHTDAGNFFPQVGVSYESLGEVWDVRANGYIPVGQKEQVGAFKPTNQIGFTGNSISNLTLATVDRSFYSAELEIARRLGAERDAWGFAGPYFVGNDNQDSAGFRAGVRGYAYPDLLLQFAVSDDDVFKTNATFSVVWFVGRTRTSYQPSCGTADRMREPVMRNDYVVLSHTKREGGVALTNTDGSALRIVHVASNAAAGGDGTFEHPYDALDDVNGTGSVKGDIILAHSTSVFNGELASVVLKDNQRLLGEGNNLVETVATKQKGTITIPESSPGARELARPQINGFTSDPAITLADSNEVSNFDIDGQGVTVRAIASPAGGSGNPNLNNLLIKNTLSNGIELTPETIADPTDATKMIVHGNVTIDKVTLDNVGGDDININSATTTDLTDPNVTLQETIAISNVTSTNGNGAGVRLIDTHSAGTASISNYANGLTGTGGGLAAEGVLRFEGSATDKFAGDVTISNADIKNNLGFAFDFLNVAASTTVTLGTGSSWDGGLAGVAGGFRANNFNGTVNASNTALKGGTLGGIQLLNASAGTFNFADTVTLTDIGGTDVDVNGGVTDLFKGTVSVGADIVNNAGRSVSIQGVSDGSITLSGDITDTDQGILVNSNTGGLMLFAGNLDMDTTTHTAVAVTDNTGAEIDFPGKVDINTTTGAGFLATGGGTLTVSAANNTITTTTGQILRIGGPLTTDGMTISTSNVRFADVNNTSAGAFNPIQIENNKGTGSIDIGTVTDAAGDAGTVNGGGADAILIHNSPNVSVNGVKINNTAAFAGVRVDKSTTTPMTVSLGNLQVNNGSDGVKVTGGGLAGNLNMTINQTAINSTTTTGLDFEDVDFGTITVTGATLDGNNASAGAKGVSINNSNATFSFDTATKIQEWSNDDFEVNGGTGTITFAGDIVNSSATNPGDTAGNSIHIRNVSGGTVNFTVDNTVDDTNKGILVTGNTGGTFNFNGDYNLHTLANDAVTITSNTGATINIGSLDIQTTSGQGFVATGGGTLTVSGTSNTIVRTAGTLATRALDIENMAIGTVDFESVNSTGGDNGIRLVDNTGGNVTIGDTGNLVNQGGTIQTTTDAGVHAQNTNVILNGVTVTNAGNAAGENGVEITHTNATTMNAQLNRLTVTNDNTTPGRNGVVVDGSGGSGTFNANVQNLIVDVKGDGFVANSGVTLTAGGTNTIKSDTGIGLRLTDTTISGSNATFQSVTVANGTTNGIRMQNVTGGQVAVTGTGSTNNSGGTLQTTGDAIFLSNVTNVDLSNVHVTGSGAQGVNIDHTAAATTAMDVTLTNVDVDAATGAGLDISSVSNTNAFNFRLLNSTVNDRVVMNHSGTGNFAVLADNNTITTTGTDVALALSFTGAAQDGDVTIRNNNNITAANASAFTLTLTGANADVEFESNANTFSNNSAASQTSNILANNGAVLNATILNNTYTNAGAAETFLMTSDGVATQTDLDLNGNTAATLHLHTLNQGVPATDFNFSVVDRNNTNANNGGTVNFDPAINQFENITGPVQLPTVP